MKTPIPSTDAESVQERTGSPRWKPSQQLEINALQSGQWWPFKRADPQVLSYLHKKAKADEINNAEDAWL